MATYNGGEFLENQIYSLLSQTHKNWRLIIHDDGSTDNTLEIVKKFQAIDSRIVLIEDGITYGNAGGNFLHLLNLSTAHYVMFCDQDDIWFESKIEIHLKNLKYIETPCAIYSNGYTYNGETITSTNFIEFHRSSIENSIFLNGGIHGCCIMLNKGLLDICRNNLPDYVFMHDHYITMLAVTFGEMIYIDKALMLYRQHDRNVTGNVNLSFTSRLKTFLDNDNPVLERRHFKANHSFFEHYKEKLTEKQADLFRAYLSFPEKSRLGRLKMIMVNGFKSKTMMPLLIKTLIRKAI